MFIVTLSDSINPVCGSSNTVIIGNYTSLNNAKRELMSLLINWNENRGYKFKRYYNILDSEDNSVKFCKKA